MQSERSTTAPPTPSLFFFFFRFVIGQDRLVQVMVALADDSFRFHGEISERE